jgi:hypothetical protein
MISYNTAINHGCTSVYLLRRDDVRNEFNRITKHFFDHMAALNFINKHKKESLVNQVNQYVIDCKKVVKSTPRRREIHAKSLHEIEDLQRMIIRPNNDLKNTGERILIYKYQLQLILPQKEDPLYLVAKKNLEEIINQAEKFSGRKRATKIK